MVAATEEDVGFDRRVTGDGVAWLLGLTRTLCPVLLQGEIAETWTGLRPGSETGDPLIGPVPGYEGLWVSAGHFRTGRQGGARDGDASGGGIATGRDASLLRPLRRRRKGWAAHDGRTRRAERASPRRDRTRA